MAKLAKIQTDTVCLYCTTETSSQVLLGGCCVHMMLSEVDFRSACMYISIQEEEGRILQKRSALLLQLMWESVTTTWKGRWECKSLGNKLSQKGSWGRGDWLVLEPKGSFLSFRQGQSWCYACNQCSVFICLLERGGWGEPSMVFVYKQWKKKTCSKINKVVWMLHQKWPAFLEKKYKELTFRLRSCRLLLCVYLWGKKSYPVSLSQAKLPAWRLGKG